jgi:lysophospholipase L1-like esterase
MGINNMTNPEEKSSVRLKTEKRHLHWYSKLIISVVSITIFLLLLEGISSLLMNWIDFPPVFSAVYKLKGNFIRDFDIGYINRPSNRFETDEKIGKCRYRINSKGLRNNYEVNDTKATNEFRILCLGDSTVFGLAVDQGETYPNQMELILNARQNGIHYLVLNAGCPNYSSFQIMRFMESRGIQLKPDVIIISVGVNDPKPRESEKSRDYRNGPLPFLRRLIFPTNTYMLFSYIKSLFIPIHRIQAAGTPAVSLSEYAENLIAIIDCAKQIGARVIFCPISVPGKYRAVLWELANKYEIEIVDAEQSLWRAYQEVEAGTYRPTGLRKEPEYEQKEIVGALVDGADLPFFHTVHSDNRVLIDIVHPNPIGYRAIAEDLAASIP